MWPDLLPRGVQTLGCRAGRRSGVRHHVETIRADLTEISTSGSASRLCSRFALRRRASGVVNGHAQNTVAASFVRRPRKQASVLALTDEAEATNSTPAVQRAVQTCRVQYLAGETENITHRKDIVAARGLTATPGLRLSCQILCDHDMELKAISRLAGTGRADAGKRPTDDIAPPPVWTTK